MPNIADVRAKLPQYADLSDDDLVDVVHGAYYRDLPRDDVAKALGVAPKPAAAPAQGGQFSSGLRRSFAEVPGLAAGAGAFVADAVGADDTRDQLLGYARRRMQTVAEDHAGDAQSFTDAWDGKTPWSDWLANSAGYVAGQALQSIGTAGVGALGMRMLAKTGAKQAAEQAAARALAAGASRDVAQEAAVKAAQDQLTKAGIRGGVAGAAAQNLNMELGSIYPEAVDTATAEGRQLDGTDLARVGLSGVAAAGVDTAMDALSASKLLRGSNRMGGLASRAAREIPAGALREGTTEAIQTGIEHYGAGKPIADAEGMRDIVDSAAVGAVGGGMAGAGASLHSRRMAEQPGAGPGLDVPATTVDGLQVPQQPPGAFGRAVQAGAEVGALQPAMPEGVDPDTGEVAPPRPTPAPRPPRQLRQQPATEPAERPTVVGPDDSQRAVFGSEQEARDYITEVRRQPRSAAISSEPIQLEDGTWTLAKPGEPGHSRTDAAGETVQPVDRTPDDIVTKSGKPFATAGAARAKAVQLGPDFQALPANGGGFVVRNKGAGNAQQLELDQGAAPPAAGVDPGTGDAGRAGTDGGLAPGGGDRAEAAPAPRADAGADAPVPVAAAGGRGRDPALNSAEPAQPAIDTVVDLHANLAATSDRNDRQQPTDGQKEAGNYKVGRLRLAGLDVSIENPQGSKRSGTSPDGKRWENTLTAHYGYVRGTLAGDGDHSDVFIRQGTPEDWTGTAYVIDQVDPKTGRFDEHKTVLGVDSEEEARALYLSNYEKGWNGLAAVTAMPVADFAAWVRDGTKDKPAGDISQWKQSGQAPKPAAKRGRTTKGASDGQQQEEGRRRQEVLTAGAPDAQRGGNTDAPAPAQAEPMPASTQEVVAEPAVSAPAPAPQTIKTGPGGARYRDPATGQTWSGRGLMPRWVRAALDTGKKLEDFLIPLDGAPAPTPAPAPAQDADKFGIMMRAAAHDDERPGDVLLAGSRRYVDFDQAKKIARQAIEARELDPTKPFQFNRVLDIAPRDWDRMVKAMEGQQDELDAEMRSYERKAAAKEAASQPPVPVPQPAPEPAPAQPTTNTVFTDDAAARARELLRRRLGPGTLNSAGIDPEVLQAGITLAGWHIEKGARRFAAYAKAMVGDLGDVVRPYLKSWYMGVKYDPRAAAWEGLDDAATVERADVDALLAPPPDAGTKDERAKMLNDRIDAIRAQLDELEVKQDAANANGNAWVYDKQIRELNAEMADYQAALQRMHAPEEAAPAPEPAPEPAAEPSPAPAPEPAAAAAAPAEPAKDGEGNPIWTKGQRVVILRDAGAFQGRHGVVSDVTGFRWRTITFGQSDAQESAAIYSYTVKTDGGAELSAIRGNELELEQGDAPAALPDIKTDGGWKTPESILHSIEYARGSIRQAEGKLSRARTAASKKEHQDTIDRKTKERAELQAAYDAWAKEHGRMPAAEPAAAPADGQAAQASTAGPGFTMVKSRHGKTGADLWLVKVQKRVERDEYDRIAAKVRANGGRWSKFTKAFEFPTEAGASDFMRAVGAGAAQQAAQPKGPEPAVTPTAAAPIVAPTLAPEQIDAAVSGIVTADVKAAAEEAHVDPADLTAAIGAQAVGNAPEVPLVDRVLAALAADPKTTMVLTANNSDDNVAAVLLPMGASYVAEFSEPYSGDEVREAFARFENRSIFGPDLVREMRLRTGVLAPTITKPQENPDDSAPTAGSPGVDRPVDAGLPARPPRSTEPVRGARVDRDGDGRPDAGGVRDSRGREDDRADESRPVGDGERPADVPDRSPDAVGPGGGRVPARDFRATPADLTREGSWFDTARRNLDLIDLARRIDDEQRPATPEEQAQLAKYVGFGAGAIRNAMFPVPQKWQREAKPDALIYPEAVYDARWRALAERAAALPIEWQRTVLQATQYQHFTSGGIVAGIWSAVQRMGFTGGKMLEPGMGIGNFPMLMPDALRKGSRYTGIEFDAPTALIARLLSPQQIMLHDNFIKRELPDDFYDLAIGNPPFSQTKITADPRYAKHGFMLHDYFFAKSIDKVRPGGLLVYVTSKGTMDKQTDKARRYLSERADLLGAIRLPSTAFEDNAGTSVVTDVIFLRKRQPGEAAAGEAWGSIQSVDTPDGPVAINEYFAAHPDMVLGQNRISGNQDDKGRRINANGYGGEKYTVVSYDDTPAELEAKFAAAVERLPANVYSVLSQERKAVERETARMDFDPKVKREGVVYLGAKGDLLRVEQGVGKALDEVVQLSDKDKAWLTSYVKLRDLVQEARLAQVTDGNWQAALRRLNDAYDKFVADHGPLTKYRAQTRKSTDEDGSPVETEIRVFVNKRLYREDYDAAIVTQLETIDEEGRHQKSAFLRDRTIGKPVTRDIKTIGDALATSLDDLGRLDLDDIGERLGIGRTEAIEALGKQVYRTPAGQWQLADEYLSGNVVVKLAQAEAAAEQDPDLKRNVEALREVQPEKLGPSQISVRLGASWVDARFVNEFAKEIEAGAVTFDVKTESWQVDGGNKRSERKAAATYGTADRSPSELLEAVLNSRGIKVMTRIDKKEVVDDAATTAAVEAARKIKEKFKTWVWQDSERAAVLVEEYNRRFNNIAPRRFDGSHLTLPGVSLRYRLHHHQLRAIWRQIQTGNTYLAHAVGSGKTIEMIAGGMEQKRLGLIKKPMYVVPNHMLEQFANEFMELYPLANIMVADDQNFSKERRKAFVAAATLNAPDAIVITHDAYQRIGVKESSVAPIRDAILADLEDELSDVEKDSSQRVRRSQLQQQIEAVEQRFDSILAAGKKDGIVDFEDMGVDFVYVDEAHVHRKLDFHTAQQIKGIDPNGSRRALDMYVKTRWLESKRPGRSMVFASGTPVTNTMGELYTIMRFFAQDELDAGGISTFDAWARMFGETVASLEPNASGKYEVVERFARFVNVPELMSRVRAFMDVLQSDQLGAVVKRPDLRGGKPNLIVVEPTAALKRYQEKVLQSRLAVSRAWKPSKEQPFNPDPVIAIISDGRFAATDPRFFGGRIDKGETTKMDRAADAILAEYKATGRNAYVDREGRKLAVKGGTQIVFYNVGFGASAAANRGFDARRAFTKRLTDGGIPRDEIAWFDDADTDAKKEAVFKGMRNGTYRVLIGSAKKMGTGVNVQNRLTMLHYMDPPWYPADVEQPHGRIIRQGNQNAEVGINWYATKGGYDATMWQMVGRKQRFIDQAFSGDKSLRTMDDLGEASQYEQAAALASGDPRALQLAGLKQDVERLERLQAAHTSEQIRIRGAIQWNESDMRSLQKQIRQLEAAQEAIGGGYFSFTEGTVGGTTYRKAGEFGQAVIDAFEAYTRETVLEPSQEPKKIGAIGKMPLTVTQYWEPGKREGDPRKPTAYHYLDLTAAGYRMNAYGGESMEGRDAVGLVTTMRAKINEVDTDLRRAQQKLTELSAETAKLRKKNGAPFEQHEEMLDKHAQLRALEDELRQEGDAAAAEQARLAADKKAGKAAPAAEPPPAPPADGSLFSRGPGQGAGVTMRDARAVVERIRAALPKAPPIYLHEKVSQAPKELAAAIRAIPDGERSVHAAFHDGAVYVFPANVDSIEELQRIVGHHEIRHYGMRSMLGPRLGPVMLAIYDGNPQVREAAEAKIAAGLADSRVEAVEEALADWPADTVADLKGVAKLLAMLREWLRGLAARLERAGLQALAAAVNPTGWSDADVARFVWRSEDISRTGSRSYDAAGTAFAAGAGDVTNTAAFRAWFADSKVVDAEGKPLVVYHGTKADVTRFDTDVPRARQAFTDAQGFYFTKHADDAGNYAQIHRQSDGGANVVPVYVRLVNPKRVTAEDGFMQSPAYISPKRRAELEAQGYDGIIYNDGDELVAFRPEQIKSAIGNRGTFDAASADIRYSRRPAQAVGQALTAAGARVRDVQLPAGYLVGDFLNRSGKLSWWHKTVGTMFDLAQRSRPFRRVFDAGQQFLNDTSFYATEAANLAPTILPKLETWKDIAKSPLSAADTKAIARPIFEGTLVWTRDPEGRPARVEDLERGADAMQIEQQARVLLQAGAVTEGELRRWRATPLDIFNGAVRNRYRARFLAPGIVWTDEELRGQWGLTAKQVGLYREFRASVDRSLKDLAVSDMLRYGGDDVIEVREAALAAGTVEEAAAVITEHLQEQAQEDLDRTELLLDTAAGIQAKADKVAQLVARGYAPLQRFGRHTVYVTEQNGEQLYFGMFESPAEASRMARSMRAAYPDAVVQQGTMSEESHRLFAGVTPETVELFGEMLGLESGAGGEANAAFQTYLRLTKSNRSAMKRLIERKGVLGFNEDAGRVLAGFVYSNARQTAGNLNMGELTDAVDKIPKGQGELKDAALRLADYVRNPQEEAAGLRGLLFAQYLGGSVASAMMNMTQPIAVTFPYLSQFGGAAAAAAQVTAAARDAAKRRTGDAQLDAALRRAEEEGIVAPQEVHQLMAQAMGQGVLKSGDGTRAGDAAARASNAWSKLSLAWGKVFSMAELANRRITFIAAYRTAVAQGMPNPARFAEQAINETQFVYNKGNRPQWARGAIGATLFTFKTYSISYLELIQRMWRAGPEGKKAAALAIGVLFLMAGLDGLPFEDDIEDVLDGLMQRLGFAWDTKRAKREALAGWLGEGGADFVLKGLSGLPGAPIDVSGRMGMGNLIPSTGLLTKKPDHARDVAEVFGPAGDLARRAGQAVAEASAGNLGRAADQLMPTAARNVVKAWQMATTGQYRDERDRKVLDVDTMDAAFKALGWQPRDVARVQEATGMVQATIAQVKMRETELADQWARAIVDGDTDGVQAARKALADWNRDNPDAPIRIGQAQIAKRVRAARMSKEDRIAATAPKELRRSITQSLTPGNP